MANSDRRVIDDKGRMLIPMNVEGSLGEENFITMPKMITLAIIVCSNVFMIALCKSNEYSILKCLILFAVIELINITLLRYIVFEEKLYYKMYRELKDGNVVNPYKFWNIASKSNTEYGTILNYNNAKTGVIVKLHRGVITGKGEGIEEEHFDALSDFYRELNRRKIKRVYINIMEQTGNDKRLSELDRLCNATDNRNLNRLVELNVTHIKNISNNTLTDVEYYLLYVDSIVDYKQLIDDVEDCMSVLMGSTYDSYEIVGSNSDRELNELAKKINFVEYFNTDEAALRIFNANKAITSSIKIVQVTISDTDKIDTNTSNIVRIINEISKKDNNISNADIIKNIVNKNDNKVGVNLSDIEKNINIKDGSNTSYNMSDNKYENNDMIDF